MHVTPLTRLPIPSSHACLLSHQGQGLVDLVYLVYLVYLVCLVGRIGGPTRRTRETRQTEQTGLLIPFASRRFQKCRCRSILRSAVPVVIIPRHSFVTSDIRGNIDELAMPVPEGSG